MIEIKDDSKYELNDPDMMNIIKAYELLFYVINYYESIMKSCYNMSQGLDLFLANQKFCNTLFQFIGIVSTHSNQDSMCFFSMTGISGFDDLINKIKAKSFNVLNLLLERAMVSEQLGQAILSNNKTYLTYIVYTLTVIVESDKIWEWLGNTEIRLIILMLLRNIRICTMSKYFLPTFGTIKPKLLIETIFSLLKTTPDEYDLMTDNPNEFVNKSIDLADYKKS